MRVRPQVVCHIGFILCFFLEVVSEVILIFNKGDTCDDSAHLSQSVNITSTVFVLLLDLIFASLILKCEPTIDPSVIIVNAWCALVCSGAGISIIFVVYYYCKGVAECMSTAGILMVISGMIHFFNAIYAYHKA